MTKTAVNDLRPCWRCDGITFWRARDGVVHCATCEPAHAAWLIAERLRAGAVRPRLSLPGRLFQSAAKFECQHRPRGPLAEKDPWGPGAQHSIRQFSPIRETCSGWV